MSQRLSDDDVDRIARRVVARLARAAVLLALFAVSLYAAFALAAILVSVALGAGPEPAQRVAGMGLIGGVLVLLALVWGRTLREYRR